MKKLRTIIADDERPARNFLRKLLSGYEDVEVVGEAENGEEAIEIIKTTKPDLAILDLQMPVYSGLEVVKRLDKSDIPVIAFVTAFDEYAIKAFDLNAVDYLLKPVEKERLRETVDRALDRAKNTALKDSEIRKMETAAKVYEGYRENFISRIPVKENEEIYFLDVSDVVSIMVDGELLEIVTKANKNYIINFRLKDIEAKLDPQKFLRLSRACLANLEMFEKVSPMPGGTYIVFLKNGQEIAVSRKQSKVLRNEFLKL